MNLYTICYEFRKAIERVKLEGLFPYNDRMRRFPNGCCDDTCDLLAFYLENEHGIHTKQLIKIYKPNSSKNRRYHAVLLLEDKEIIDLTGDQLPYGEAVFVDRENRFYESMKYDRLIENYDIRNDQRLWNDYIVILDKMRNDSI